MMKCIARPFGSDGWKEKITMAEQIVGSRSCPPFVYDDVLILVSHARMKRAYGRLFLDVVNRLHGASALVMPSVMTLHQFFEKLYAARGLPPVIDAITNKVLIEGIVKERLKKQNPFFQSPDILAPSLSSSLEDMIKKLSSAGISPQYLETLLQNTEYREKPQVQLLMHTYSEYRSSLNNKNLIDPSGMQTALLEHFDPAWIASYKQIIIDGIQEIGQLEAALLRKIAASAEGRCMVENTSPAVLKQANEHHPAWLIKEFILSLGLSLPDQSISPKQDDLFLASALFSDISHEELLKTAPPASLFAKKINILSAINKREEISFIARMVKKLIMKGAQTESILVAFPSLDEYAPLVEEVFTDYGIPYNRSLGRQLSTSPVTTSLIALLQTVQDDYRAGSLLRIFSSPFLKFAEHPMLAPACDRFLRENSLINGEKKILAALPVSEQGQEPDIFVLSLRDLFTTLELFTASNSASLVTWMSRLNRLIAWSGLEARVTAVHGPLNINLQAYRKLQETLELLAQAGRQLPEFSYTFHEWLFLIKKTFMQTRFQVPPEDETGVQVLGIQESMGLPWDHIFCGGMIEGTFPRHLTHTIFLPEPFLEKIKVHASQYERLLASYHFYRLLLSAENITLTWPENEGDRPVVPSPFLKELSMLEKNGFLNQSISAPSGIQFSLAIEDSFSIPELAKAVSRVQDQKTMHQIFEAGIPEIAALKPRLEAERNRQNTHAQAATGLCKKREFRVTELDDYIRCPYDYYVRHILRIAPLEELTEDISPLTRGSKIHALLRNFYLTWNTPITRENRHEAQSLLIALANSAFGRIADTVRNRREKTAFQTIMIERFLDAEEAFWKQNMRPAFLEHRIDSFPLKLNDGSTVTLSAIIDRIDIDQTGNFFVIDYKTGKYPQPIMGTEQEIFQLPVYAVMAAAMASSAETTQPFLQKPIGLAYYDLAGKYGSPARDVVLYDADNTDQQPSLKPRTSPKSSAEFLFILEQSMNKARQAAEGILDGNFEPEPLDDDICQYCANAILCGRHDAE